MISKIEQFFKDRLEVRTEDAADSLDQKLMIATTVLFLEMAFADSEVSKEEENHIQDTLHDFFDLDQPEIEELIEVASDSRNNRNDIWLFTNLLKQNFDRIAVMKSGKIGEMGTYSELMAQKGLLHELVGGRSD